MYLSRNLWSLCCAVAMMLWDPFYPVWQQHTNQGFPCIGLQTWTCWQRWETVLPMINTKIMYIFIYRCLCSWHKLRHMNVFTFFFSSNLIRSQGFDSHPMTAWLSCIPLFLNHFQLCCLTSRGRGAVAQWSGHSTLSQEVWVQGLAGSMWCVRGKDTYLSQCLSPPRSINGY